MASLLKRYVYAGLHQWRNEMVLRSLLHIKAIFASVAGV